MPFYEYQCATCRTYHEALQKITDGPLRKCPSCGKSTLRKLVSAPVFRLKGGGWYETDFKADKEGQRNIAGDKEPVVEKPKEEKPAAAVTDAPLKPAEVPKTTQATDKSKPDSTKSSPARKRPTRQRVRK
ncbi:MAG: zinc ribbon domain-containing protein [Steroidobacteraceae bacterium]